MFSRTQLSRWLEGFLAPVEVVSELSVQERSGFGVSMGCLANSELNVSGRHRLTRGEVVECVICETQSAQQGARANAGICHAACCRMCFGSETNESDS
jgi:hypothetical protein